MVRCLRLHAASAECTGLIPGWGNLETRILHNAWLEQNKKKQLKPLTSSSTPCHKVTTCPSLQKSEGLFFWQGSQDWEFQAQLRSGYHTENRWISICWMLKPPAAVFSTRFSKHWQLGTTLKPKIERISSERSDQPKRKDLTATDRVCNK